MIAGIGKAAFEGLRVLFLEDEALVLMSHAEILQDLGCRVTECITIAEALAAIQHEAFDLGLLDVNIGGEMSYSVAAALQKREVPIAFITGYQSPALVGEWRIIQLAKSHARKKTF
jgi:Response regulator containing CheY-like receiver, AAA-type ATPase, and DNA-binding domains